MVKTPQIVFVQNDRDAYCLTIKLIVNRKPIDLTNTNSIYINFKRPDGAIIKKQAKKIGKKGTIEYKIEREEMLVEGINMAEVQIFSSTGQRITSAPFQYHVRKELHDKTMF